MLSHHKMRLGNLICSPEEGPTAEANDPPVVADVLLVGLGLSSAGIAGCQVEPVIRVLGHWFHHYNNNTWSLPALKYGS